MLHDKKLVAFIATSDSARAKWFYTDVLGLLLVRENDLGLVYENRDTLLRIQKVQSFTPHPFTALGWEVPDIEAAMKALTTKSVRFEQYGLPGQEASGVWTAPSGTKVAWFKDPDGNVLSLSTVA